MNKIAALSAVFLFGLSQGLWSQSLVELARKEKERRESLKGQAGAVVTNEDLAKVTKTPAIETTGIPVIPETIREEGAAAEDTAASPGSVRRIIPRVVPPGPVITGEGESSDQASAAGDLKERLREAEEMGELLTLKMNALWQKFYNMDDMTTQDLVQQEIADTYEKLVKSQEDAGRLRERLGLRDDR
ncbi:MAG: hypothetical protein SCM96_14560 [Acidobacteriota bacterium]|nr:hypothetical protein [Acidobacteriota bacterium]